VTSAGWANIVLAVHFTYVAGVALPILLILLSPFFHWRFIRNNSFRNIHLAMMGFVILEVVLNERCPLTLLEHHLRHSANQHMYQGGCVQYWMSRLFRRPVSSGVSTALDIFFGWVVLALYWKIPPEWLARWKWRRALPASSMRNQGKPDGG